MKEGYELKALNLFDRCMLTVVRSAAGSLMLVGLIGFIYYFGHQVVAYLRNGYWVQLGVLDVIGGHFPDSWARSADSWVGLHAIFNFFNAGFACLATGLVLGASVLQSIEDR